MTYARNLRPRKPRRRLLFASLFGVTLLLFGSYIGTFFVKDASIPSAEAAVAQGSLANAQLAWPAVGQAAVGSVEDGSIARSSDNEKLRPMASMAKVVTALAIMEKQSFELGQPGQSYKLTSKDVVKYRTEVARGGSVVPVYEGLVLTQHQAMQMMLIASSNNISDTLVERIFGGEEAYTAYAQDMLQRMGLRQTVVADASGFSPSTVSTPSELITIGIAALKNPVIAEIIAQQQTSIPGIGIIKNTNELLGADGVVGIKTGTTDQAGKCLLFAAHYSAEDGHKVTIVGVIMGEKKATTLFSDSRKLLASAKQGLGLADIPSGSIATPSHGRRTDHN